MTMKQKNGQQQNKENCVERDTLDGGKWEKEI